MQILHLLKNTNIYNILYLATPSLADTILGKLGIFFVWGNVADVIFKPWIGL